jgi:hypothetical protein
MPSQMQRRVMSAQAQPMQPRMGVFDDLADEDNTRDALALMRRMRFPKPQAISNAGRATTPREFPIDTPVRPYGGSYSQDLGRSFKK